MFWDLTMTLLGFCAGLFNASGNSQAIACARDLSKGRAFIILPDGLVKNSDESVQFDFLEWSCLVAYPHRGVRQLQ